jgi:ABC-type polar amino acid transport system ATPase subunit
VIDQIRQKVGMVFQQFNLFPHLSVLDNLTLAPIQVAGMTPHAAQELAMAQLERVRIGEQAHKFPLQLSGGQQQRVAIARALAMKPQAMLFDEPTTGVDPIARRSLFKMLKQLRSSSILLTTHRMDEAESLCDKIAIMINGKFVCYGSPGHLKQKYGKGYEIIVKPLPGQLPDYLDREILMRLPFCRREVAIDQQLNR